MSTPSHTTRADFVSSLIATATDDGLEFVSGTPTSRRSNELGDVELTFEDFDQLMRSNRSVCG
jgi:hypothetical protein